jgi:hypothetical protein
MQIAVSVPVVRSGHDIQATLTRDDDVLTFDLPTVQRKPGCVFTVGAAELQQAQDTLAAAAAAEPPPPIAPPLPPPDHGAGQ